MSDFFKQIIKETGNEYASIVSEGVEAGDVSSFIDTGSYIFNGLLFFKIQKLIFRNYIAKVTSCLYISSPLILYLGHAYMPETSMLTFYLLAYYFFIKNK